MTPNKRAQAPDDLVEKLSKDATHGAMATWALCHEAAAEILRLRAEVKSARLAALREAVKAAESASSFIAADAIEEFIEREETDAK